MGRTPVKAITVQDLEGHYAGLSGRLGPASIQRVHSLIGQALRRAVKTGEIGHSPAVYVDLPRQTRRKELKVLSPEDFSRFLQAVQGHRFGALWALALATGCRPSEVYGLRWGDLQGRSLTIQRVLMRPIKLQEGMDRWRLEDCKTKGSHRTVKLPDEVLFLLRQHKARQDQEKAEAGSAYEDFGFVFATGLGQPVTHSVSQRALPRVLAAAGLPALNPYALRHSCATGLLAAKTPLKVVSSQLGHSRSQTTMDKYMHTTSDMMDEVADTMGAMFAGKANKTAIPHAKEA